MVSDTSRLDGDLPALKRCAHFLHGIWQGMALDLATMQLAENYCAFLALYWHSSRLCSMPYCDAGSYSLATYMRLSARSVRVDSDQSS